MIYASQKSSELQIVKHTQFFFIAQHRPFIKLFHHAYPLFMVFFCKATKATKATDIGTQYFPPIHNSILRLSESVIFVNDFSLSLTHLHMRIDHTTQCAVIVELVTQKPNRFLRNISLGITLCQIFRIVYNWIRNLVGLTHPSFVRRAVFFSSSYCCCCWKLYT